VDLDTPLPHVSEATEHLPIEPAFPAEEALRSGTPLDEEATDRREPPQTTAPARQASLSPEVSEEPRVEKPPYSPTPGEDLYVQVLATRQEEAARRLRERLSGRDYPVTVISLPDAQGRPLYRVRVGGYRTREEAERVAARLEKEERLKTWIP